MTTTRRTTTARRVARALAVTPALVLLTGAAPAFAARPEGWPEPPDVSVLDALLVLLVIPGGVALLISLLVMVPSMARREGAGYHPGLAWRHEPEWFGGPRDGLDKADRTDPQAVEAGGDRGGASGRW